MCDDSVEPMLMLQGTDISIVISTHHIEGDDNATIMVASDMM
jgi:hypothetical protein